MAVVGGSERVLTPCDVTHPNGIPNEKTGTVVTATIHIFCAVVGAGVLALPRVVAWLGWVGGPLALIVFYLIQLASSRMLAMVYCVDGVEHARYHHAVRNLLGNVDAIFMSIFQCANIFLITVAYTITGALAMKTIASQACQVQGIAEGDCWNTTWKLTLIFSASQVFLSQVPNLESAWWVSFIGVGTSLFYCMVALVLGLVYSGNHLGTVKGIEGSNVNKAFGVLNALGGVAFAYSFSIILVEIQDTLRQPPSAIQAMKRAVSISVTGAFIFYFIVSVAGYVSLGNDVPGMVLEGFPDAPTGLLLAANVAILLHMCSAYQVFGQPLFDTIESHIKAFRLRRQGVTPVGAITDAEKPAPAVPGVTVAPYPAAPGAASGPDVSFEQAVRNHLVRNTAPHPTLRPEGWGEPVRISARAGSGPTAGTLDSRPSYTKGLSRLSRISQMAGMYHVDTGLANESVPLNDEHYLLPLWQRIIVRTAYVAVTCILAVVIPFFGDMVGLIGALTFFPIAVWYPFRMYNKVYHPKGWRKNLMIATGVLMLLVCSAATIAAFRNIIQSWSNVELFGDT